MAKRKKLYFDVVFTTDGFNNTNLYALCPLTPSFASFAATLFTAAGACAGNHVTGVTGENCSGPDEFFRVLPERYGGFLDTLPALTAGSSPELRRRNGVSAWFQLWNQGRISGDDSPSVDIMFVRPGVKSSGASGRAAVPILYPTGAPALSVPGKLGQDAVFATDFGALVIIRRTDNDILLFGTLYVQRQHSIEV